MRNLPLPTAEIVQRGKEWYEKLRSHVETPQNTGKLMVINVQTGDYEIDAVGRVAGRRLLDKEPDAALYELRIGYDAAYSILTPFFPDRLPVTNNSW